MVISLYVTNLEVITFKQDRIIDLRAKYTIKYFPYSLYKVLSEDLLKYFYWGNFILQEPRASNMASLREMGSYILCETSLILVNCIYDISYRREIQDNLNE